MLKEYLGANAVNDLFDIIDENYVSKEELENREKAIASAVCVGSALIAEGLLKVAEAIANAKSEGGSETVDDSLIASDSNVDDMLDNVFGADGISSVQTATDENVNDRLDNIFD